MMCILCLIRSILLFWWPCFNICKSKASIHFTIPIYSNIPCRIRGIYAAISMFDAVWIYYAPLTVHLKAFELLSWRCCHYLIFNILTWSTDLAVQLNPDLMHLQIQGSGKVLILSRARCKINFDTLPAGMACKL